MVRQNSVDPDEMAHKSPRLDLHCLLNHFAFFSISFFSEFVLHPFLIHRLLYILKLKSLSQKLRAWVCVCVCDHACKQVCGCFLHCLPFFVTVNSYSHAESVSSNIHTFFSRKASTSILLYYHLLLTLTPLFESVEGGEYPSKHIKLGHYQPASITPPESRFACGSLVARNLMLAGAVEIIP